MLLRQSSRSDKPFSIERVISLTLVLLAGVGIALFLQVRLFASWDLRHGLWSPSFLLVHGADPYGMGAPMQVVPSVWLPMAIGLFFPLGWLDFFQVTNLWLLLNAAIVVMIVWLVGKTRRPSPVFFAICVGAAFLFPPFLSLLLLGQFSILAALLFLLASYVVSERLVLASSFLVAVALTKPQLGILALPGLLVGFWRVGGIRIMLLFVATLIVSIAWLTLPFWLVYPPWIGDLIQILRAAPTWLQPSLFHILQNKFGDYGLVFWILFAFGTLALNIWLWLTRLPRHAMVWSLALTTLVSPYVWSWDFVLLLPLMAHAASHNESFAARLTLGVGYAVCWFAAVTIRLNTDNSDERFWWLAPTIILFVCGAFVVDLFFKSRLTPTGVQ